MGILRVKERGRWRGTLPVIALIFGLMAVALSCGGSAEFADSASAPARDESAQPAGGAPGPVGGMGGQGAQGPAGPAATVSPATAAMAASEDGHSAAATPAVMERSVEVPQSAAATMSPVASSLYGGGPDSPFGRDGRVSGGADGSGIIGIEGDSGISGGGDGGSGGDAQSVAAQGRIGRNLIVEAWISLQVDAIDAVARQVEGAAAARGGWVESADIVGEGGYRTATISVRVPAERFDETMTALRSLGIVTDEGVASQDVTEQLVDNEARMTAWRAQEERLVALLENAATVEDIVDIERRISEVRTDIEYVAAAQRNLQNRVAASLIRVSLHLPRRFAADPPTGQLNLAVSDPTGAADAVTARVDALNGYTGEKREYRQGNGDAVELTAFVRPSDLAGLMDFAANLGEIADRRLDSVGPSPLNDEPNARLILSISSNVSASASLDLGAVEAIDAAEQVRARAESLGGYVETWHEQRQEESDSVSLTAVVKAADVRPLLEYAAGLGETRHWEYQAAGQTPADAVPNARLRLSVSTDDDGNGGGGGGGEPGMVWLAGIAGAAAALLAAGAVAAGVFAVRRRRRLDANIRAATANANADAGAGSDAGGVSGAAAVASGPGGGDDSGLPR